MKINNKYSNTMTLDETKTILRYLQNSINYLEYGGGSSTVMASKIWIATQAAYGDITPRYFEIMGSGTLLFCEKNPVEYSHVFKDGYNCIEFDSSLDNFEYILIKLLRNPVLFNQVTQCGKIDAMRNQTWDVRASQFVSLVQEFL